MYCVFSASQSNTASDTGRSKAETLPIMRDFSKEWKTLRYVTENASRVLLFAHSRPDPDTVGANIALKYFLEQKGKKSTLAAFDRFSSEPAILFLKLNSSTLIFSDLDSYDAIIACDSVDRGFDKVSPTQVRNRHGAH
jgi:nanoRNase/pAp phosphatase (c-di-AMP/oligoRNAs hydrolase)